MPGPTKLSKQNEKKYQQWRSLLPIPLQYEGDYDLRGLWKKNPNMKPSANLHFPDTYKLPNHPTFSNESIYFNPQTKDSAGYWQQTDSSYNYIPYNPQLKDTVIEKKMPNGGRVKNKYQPGTSETLTNLGRNMASYFLGVKNTSLIPSTYRPTKSTDPKSKYYTMQYLKNDVKDDLLRDSYIQNINDQQNNFVKENPNYHPSYIKDKNFDQYYNYYTNSPKSNTVSGSSINLGHYSVTPGNDERGRYLGIYDKYDWNLLEQAGFKGNPWETYDRIYEDEWDKIPTKKMPDGGSVQKWTQEYIKSPKYKERLSNFYKYPEYIQGQREQQVRNIQFVDNSGSAAQYDTSENKMYLPRSYDPGISPMEVQAHELSHATNANPDRAALRLSSQEESYIYDRTRFPDQSLRSSFQSNAREQGKTVSQYLKNGPTHDLAPSENKSDIDAFRYLLNQQGIYNAGKQDITPEVLQRAKQNPAVQKSFSSKRLFQNFQDKDLIDIMNKVAMNKSKKMQPMARGGASLQYIPDTYAPNIFTDDSMNQRSFYSGGGLSREKNYGSKSKPYPSVSSRDFAGGGRSYPIPSRSDAVDALRLAGLHHRPDVKAKVYAKYPELRKDEYGGIINTGYPAFEDGGLIPIGLEYEDYPHAKSGIHIKPENKGKFTAYKKRTGKTTEEALHSKNPHVRQMANFARNAKEWHHGEFGLDLPFYDPMDIQPLQTQQLGYPDIPQDLQNPIPTAVSAMNLPQQKNPRRGGNDNKSGVNMNLNLGTLAMGLAGIVNQNYDHQRPLQDYARNQRRTAMQPVYNPYQYGNNSQALFNDGGYLPGSVHDLTPEQIFFLQRQGYDLENI
jgi:hypothetical protein